MGTHQNEWDCFKHGQSFKQKSGYSIRVKMKSAKSNTRLNSLNDMVFDRAVTFTRRESQHKNIDDIMKRALARVTGTISVVL
jgi:hypothetical protein